jgi:Conserved hypothetical protein (Lin0512_fam)
MALLSPDPGQSVARVRSIAETGMGFDVHGRDAPKAARQAVYVIRLSSLGFFRMLGKTPHDMFVDVTTSALDRPRSTRGQSAPSCPIALAGGQGAGHIERHGHGRQAQPRDFRGGGGDAIRIANAALVVSLDRGAGASS